MIFPEQIMDKKWFEEYREAWDNENRPKLLQLVNEFEKKVESMKKSFVEKYMEQYDILVKHNKLDEVDE